MDLGLLKNVGNFFFSSSLILACYLPVSNVHMWSLGSGIHRPEASSQVEVICAEGTYPSLHLYCAMPPDVVDSIVSVVTIPLMGLWGAPQLTVEYQISIGMQSGILQNTR